MKEIIIVEDGRKYFYTNGKAREQITAKQADKSFQEWIKAGRSISRKYSMGGKVTWVWPE